MRAIEVTAIRGERDPERVRLLVTDGQAKSIAYLEWLGLSGPELKPGGTLTCRAVIFPDGKISRFTTREDLVESLVEAGMVTRSDAEAIVEGL